MNNAETRRQRFERIANIRTNSVLDKIRILGHLSNKQVYDYTDKDIERIFSAINRHIKETRARFNYKKPKKFKL